MAATTHDVVIYCIKKNEVDAKCRCGWSTQRRVSAVDAKSEWLKHVKKRGGKPGTIRIQGL